MSNRNINIRTLSPVRSSSGLLWLPLAVWLTSLASPITAPLYAQETPARANNRGATQDESEAAPKQGAAFGADRTERVLRDMRTKNGLRDLKSVRNDKILMHLHITQPAEMLIQNRTFEVKDNQFDLEPFTDAVAGLFLESVDYFFSIVPDAPVKEFHLVIDDLGEARQTTSAQAWRHSRLIQIDFRRWHKMYRGRSTPTAYSSSIHEFTHIVNYVLDAKEDKYHLELTAIVFETMNFIRNQGLKVFEDTYLKTPLKTPTEITSPQYISNTPLRYIAYSFIRKSLDWTYTTDASLDSPEKRSKAIERFAALYLGNPKTGNAGINGTLLAMGFKDLSGAPLTLERIQQDVYVELTQ